MSAKRYAQNIVDLEEKHNLNNGAFKESLKDILKKYQPELVIDNKQIHHPVYDAKLLFFLHQAISKKIKASEQL